LPGIAACCVRVRVKLGSFGAGNPWIARRGSVACHMWQALEGPPNRRGEGPTRDFNLRVRLPVPFTRADIHAGLTHVVLTSMRRTGAKGSQSVLPSDPCRMLDTDFGELPLCLRLTHRRCVCYVDRQKSHRPIRQLVAFGALRSFAASSRLA
jgi:hypothetical protein